MQAGPKGKFRGFLSWSNRNCRDVQLLGSSHLPGFGFVRSNCACKQNSRPATDHVFGVGPGKLPRSGSLNTLGRTKSLFNRGLSQPTGLYWKTHGSLQGTLLVEYVRSPIHKIPAALNGYV